MKDSDTLWLDIWGLQKCLMKTTFPWAALSFTSVSPTWGDSNTSCLSFSGRLHHTVLSKLPRAEIVPSPSRKRALTVPSR